MQSQKMQSEKMKSANSSSADLSVVIKEVENFKKSQLADQDAYSKLRSAREKATFSMMMKMNPDALTNIRKEFFARMDSVTLDEFIYIIQKHLVNRKGDDSFVMETPEQREFGTNMYELFKDIDVNGDGQLEWQVTNPCLALKSLYLYDKNVLSLVPSRNSLRSLWRKPTCLTSVKSSPVLPTTTTALNTWMPVRIIDTAMTFPDS